MGTVEVDRPEPTSPVRDRDFSRGLRGGLDAPVHELVTPGKVHVAGWTFHKSHPVRQVLITFDGEPVAVAATGEPRPDVLAVHSAHAAARHAGWSIDVDYPHQLLGDVEVAAYAVVDTGQTDNTRFGPLFRFGAKIVRSVQNRTEFGTIVPLTQVTPGYVEIFGTARHPAGLARVEVVVAGGEPVLARHSLPGRAPGRLDLAHDVDHDVAGFSAFVQIPVGTDQVEIEATVIGVDGTRAALTPMEVAVTVPPPEPYFTPAQAEAVAARASRQVAALQDSQEEPRRVLLATHDLGVGGAQLYLHLLVKKLRERGLDFCLVTGAGGALLAEIEEELDIPVLVVGGASTDRRQLEAQMLQIASFAARHRVVGGLANTLLAFPAMSALQQLGLPTTWAIHESFEPASFFRQYYGEQLPGSVVDVAMNALRACDEVVFEAEATRDIYRPYVSDARAAVVPYGVDLTQVDDYAASHTQERVRAELSLPRDSRVLVCVGKVEPRKGQLALVRAFGRLPAHLRENCELVLVGAGTDPYSVALSEYIESAGLDGVRLVPVDPDVLRWYYAADVLVSASDVESVPRSMLEAMAMGRPVAATDVFGVGELVADGLNGFTCDALDLASLTAMLRRVVETGSEEIQRLGVAARELIRERHDPAGYTDHFAERLSPWLAGHGLREACTTAT